MLEFPETRFLESLFTADFGGSQSYIVLSVALISSIVSSNSSSIQRLKWLNDDWQLLTTRIPWEEGIVGIRLRYHNLGHLGE